MEGDHAEPTLIEDFFARIEGHVGSTIQSIKETRRLPKGDELYNLLMYSALLLMRVPKSRKLVRNIHLSITDRLAKLALKDRDGWNQIVEEAQSQGIDIPGQPSYEEIKRSYDEGRIRPAVNKDLEISTILGSAIDALPFFLRRNWGIVDISGTESEFVLADCPIVPTVTIGPVALSRLAFASVVADWMLPLSKDLAMSGTLRTIGRRSTLSVDDIGRFNYAAVSWADRFVYFSPTEPRVVLPNGATMSILEALKQWQ